MRRLVLAIALAALGCDGDAWSPRAERARAESERAAALAAHLETLPGVREASVVLELPISDPLAPPCAAVPCTARQSRASVVLALDPGADPAAAESAARGAVAGAIAGAAVTVVTAAPPPSESLVAVGPFRVAEASRVPLLAALAAGLLAIAGLAIWIAVAGYRVRRRA